MSNNNLLGPGVVSVPIFTGGHLGCIPEAEIVLRRLVEHHAI